MSTARIKPIGAIVAGAFLLAGSLTGCSSAGRIFGLERTTPDEFAVMSRAPLTVPPEFNLRPPQPGAPRPQEEAASERAETLVFGQTGFGPATGVQRINVSPGEGALLAQAGAAEANPDIRQIVNQEATDLLVADQSFVDRLLFWQEPEPPGVVVDPEAEARRLQTNAALGDPITQGEVPVIERRSRAPLEGLFNF